MKIENYEILKIHDNLWEILRSGGMLFGGVRTAKELEETFGSSCHGASRVQSRHQALTEGKGKNLIEELTQQRITIQAKGYKTIAEEKPYAFKNVA